jgi:hypothetical protein
MAFGVLLYQERREDCIDNRDKGVTRRELGRVGSVSPVTLARP